MLRYYVIQQRKVILCAYAYKEYKFTIRLTNFFSKEILGRVRLLQNRQPRYK